MKTKTKKREQMPHTSHNDAPAMNDTSMQLYNMVQNQAPYRDVMTCLLDEFNVVDKVMTAPTYIQPNGFWTFKLGGIDGDHLLRLHFWPKGLPDEGKSAGIHDHIFDFTSLVLDSDAPMINTRYQISEDDSSPLSLYVVDYMSAKKSNITKLSGHFMASAKHEESIATGEYYTLPAGEFHTSRIKNDAYAMTLMTTKINPDIKSPRFLSEYFDTKAPYERQELSTEQRELVVRTLGALKP